MRKIILDGKKMLDREISHRYLKEAFNFPYYYGENLDALWDMLNSISSPMDIEFINKYDLVENLGTYANTMIKVFEDAEKENSNIKLWVYD